MEELHGRAEMGRIGRTGHLGVECTETEAQRTLDVEMILGSRWKHKTMLIDCELFSETESMKTGDLNNDTTD